MELALTAHAARRLARIVPPEAFVQPHIYRLPLTDATCLLPIIEAKRKG